MRRFVTVTAIAFALLALPSVAAAQSTNDNFEDAVGLTGGEFDRVDTTGNTLQPDEPQDCGVGIAHTAWYAVQIGDSGRVSVDTIGSDFDTVISVYGPDDGGPIPGGQHLGCNDDRKPGEPRSEAAFEGSPGDWYLIQVGGCTGDPACGASSGTLVISAYDSPENDDRAAADLVATGETTTGTNAGATDEDERLSCDGSPYGKTVW